ncbi:MAG: citrate synthase [Vicinamibacteria bacterium]|nr:citrate synthase [Vicinamibacteria bacterium]
MGDVAKLIVDGKEHELQIVKGSEGERAVVTSRLRETAGLITLDPALMSTGSCQSAITFIDGEKGVLRYRGIPIQEFRESPNFIEVAYLLIFGKLPNQAEYDDFSARLTSNAMLHEAMRHHFEGFPVDAPPMAILSAMLNTLSCFHVEFLKGLDDPEVFTEAAARLISKVRTIAAFTYRRSRGLPFMYPDPKLRYCANFLHMMFSSPYQQYEVRTAVEDALNLLLILHADHEQNCSTSTVRLVGSAHANLFASCAAGVCALWGRLHGGANVEVLEMLERIHKGGLTPEKCVEMAKDKKDPFKLSGFGHRVYKNYDPRARIIKESCDRVLTAMGRKDPLLDIARKLEEIVLADSYFVERRLYPNVDFYSGIILRALGIPTNMFTVMFAIGRLPGWIAHWKEQHDDKTSKIWRPRQLYTGNTLSRYVPIQKRD